MKKAYGLLGFAGFVFIVGAAGGADTAPVGVSAALMCLGFVMMVLSELFVGLYNRRIRLRKINAGRVVAKRRVRHSKRIVPSVPVNTVNYKHVVRRQPELC